jgi:hypothetical protein
MAYKSTNFMFRDLTDAEEAQFRKWARENYKPGSPISTVWHPVAQDECVKMNAELGTSAPS